MTLTSKEFQLIGILSRNQNQIIKRDVLIKEVWEDNGVFVGRNLETVLKYVIRIFIGRF